MADEVPLLGAVLAKTERFLRTRGVPRPRLEAEQLAAAVLGLPRIQLYLQFDRPLTLEERGKLRGLVARRGHREPLAWLLGQVGFHAVDLEVGPGVLVPRPDTETLVDAAIGWIEPGAHVVDIGTGTGAIAIALAVARPDLTIVAVEREAAPLAIARANVARHGVAERVRVVEGDLLQGVPDDKPIDWIVSNPPYIPTADIDALEPEVSRHEPRAALDGGADGLRVLARIAALAGKRAAKGVLLEVGAGQAVRVADGLRRVGFPVLRTFDDAAGVARVVGGRREEAP